MLFGDVNALTVAADQIVIQGDAANTAAYDAIQPFAATDQIVFAARYDHTQLTTSINQWSVMMQAGAGNTVTYTDAFNAGTVVTLSTATSTTNQIWFETDANLGGPARVGATFQFTTAATNNTALAATANIITLTMGGVSTVTCGTPLVAKQVGGYTVWVPRELTDEEKAERAAQQAEFQRQQAAEVLARSIADGKAEVLLRKVLTAKQRAELEEVGHFHVWGKDGFKYQINRTYGHNVLRVCPDTGKVLKRYCVVPKLFIPSSDRLLAQKLMLEADAERFVKLANVAEPLS